MDFHHKEFNKNKIIIPVLFLMLLVAGYVASKLSSVMTPMTLDEYEQRYPVPEIPTPFISR